MRSLHRQRGQMFLASWCAVFVVLLATSLWPVVAAEDKPESIGDERGPVDVYILAGQSNMVGQGRLEALDPREVMMPGNVAFHDYTVTFRRSDFERWTRSSHEYDGQTFLVKRPIGKFGPELGFAQTMAAARPDRGMAIVKFALGGTGIEEWDPLWSTELFGPRSRQRVRGPLYDKVLGAVRTAPLPPGAAYRGLLWFQGENDARSQEDAEDYGENLRALIAAWRRDLGVPDLPVFVGLINPRSDAHAHVDIVVAQMRKVASRDHNVHLVSSEGLSKLPDEIHYDTAGQLELGRRFARTVLQATGRRSARAAT